MTNRKLDYETCLASASKCKTRYEFKRLDRQAYRKACKMGWIEKLVPYKAHKTLDYDTCYNIAKQCKTRTDFFKMDHAAYYKAMRSGWLDKWIPEYHWRATAITFEQCKNAVNELKAKGFNKISDFKREYPQMLKIARCNGWIEKLIPYKAHKTLDYDTCYNIAKQCKTRTDFFKMDHAAYYKAMRSGWLDKWIPEYHWRATAITFEQCKNAVNELKAKGFNKISDFKREYPQMLKIARCNGWIEQLEFQDKQTSYRLAGERCRKYTLDEIVDVAHTCPTLKYFRETYPAMYSAVSKYQWHDKISFLEQSNGYKNGLLYDTVYVYEFPMTNVAYIGRTIDLKRRHYDHCHNDNDSIVQYAKSIGVSIPEPRILSTFAIKTKGDKHGEMECKMIALYRSLGWSLLNKARGGSMGSIGFGKWTIPKLLEVAKPFKYWNDFAKAYPGLYSSICHKKLRDKFPWLKLKKTTNGFWSTMSKEDAYQYAKECSTRKEFADKYSALSQHCSKKGWVDEWFTQNYSAPKRICQYTVDGTLIKTHSSIAAAAREAQVSSGCMCDCVKGRGRVIRNYVWAYESTAYDSINFPGQNYKPRNAKCRIHQFSMDDQLIHTYESIKSAADAIGMTAPTIRAALIGRTKTAGGYKWAYADAA